MKWLCCIVVLLILYIVLIVNGQSPCPGIFDYQNDGHGSIRVRSNGPVTSVTTRANFTIAARLPTNYVGTLEPIGSHQILHQFNQGATLTYRVLFPITSPAPRLTALTVNDNLLCYGPGDIPGPGQYVSTISLQHMLYLRPGGSINGINGIFNQFPNEHDQHKPNPTYNIYGSNGQNTQMISFDDKYGSWNNNFDNSSPQFEERPQFGRPQFEQRPQFERPEFEQRPQFERPEFEERPQFERPQFETRPQYEPPTQTPTRPSTQRPDYNVYYPEPTQPTRPPTPPPPPPTFPPSPPRLPSSPVSSNIECGVIFGGNERLPLIFNGQSYSRGDWPWLVAIYKRKYGSLTFICSGTLVSDRHVVTAAHCLRQKNAHTHIKDVVVKVGVYNLEDWGDDITVTRTLETAYIHESYNASTLANDILVFTFERSVEFNNNIRPACLWSGNSDLSRIVGASGVVAGWGTNELGAGGHGEPRMVRLPVVSTATCRASKPDFHKLTSANTLCAGDRNGAGPCLGDSGGGLYLLDNGRWRVRGVVSLSLRPENGDNTCNLNEYIVFTDAAQYLRWIKGILAT